MFTLLGIVLTSLGTIFAGVGAIQESQKAQQESERQIEGLKQEFKQDIKHEFSKRLGD